MGEEEKKPAEEKKMEDKKPEDGKKGDGEKKEKSEEAKPADEKPAAAAEEKKAEESKDSKESPAPPQEIILNVPMHCQGCARKFRRSLKGLDGVEGIMTDCKSNKLVVKGEKADPLKVLARVQRKSHQQVELLSPIPKPPAPEEKKPEEPKPEEKKEEPKVITVVLKVHMHCEACAQEIKRRIQRMKGVETAEPDLKSSEVTVKGVFEASKLVEYVYKRFGKHAVIVKQEPENKQEEEKAKDANKEAKKGEEGGDKEKKEGGGDDSKDKKEGGDNTANAAAAEGGAEETKALELKKNEYYYYPVSYATEVVYPACAETDHYPPQIFSDENPNACSVM